MNRDKAREYFKSLGLTYSSLTKEDILTLSNILTDELNIYYLHGGEHAQQMDMKVSKPRVKDVKVLKKTGLQYAIIQVDGSYFKRREGITFASSGFIGFGAEFSDINVQPILKAFVKWCDLIKNKHNDSL